MAEHQHQAAQQAREMQGSKRPEGKDEGPKKDENGVLIGANIAADGKPIAQVGQAPHPGPRESALLGGVGIYGSGQDQEQEEVEARGKEENERRDKENEELTKKAEQEEQEAQKANEEAQAEAKKPQSERDKAAKEKAKAHK